MRRTLFAITAALLMALPACCMYPHRGGPGGPGHGCGCTCCQQNCQKQDCPKPDCPQHQQPPAK